MPEDPATEIGPLISAQPARDGRGLRRHGRRRGRAAGRRRRAARRRAGHGFFYRADGAGRRAQRHDRRPGGDLRPGRQRDHVPRRGRRGPDRQRHPVRALGLALDARRPAPLRVARALRTGVLGVNTNSSVFVQTPFGGYKQSGSARSSACTRSSTTRSSSPSSSRPSRSPVPGSESVSTNLGRAPSTRAILICKDPTLVPGTRTAPSLSPLLAAPLC